MKPQVSKALDDELVLRAITGHECGLRMGGHCYPWAAAIQRALLPKGRIIVAINDPIYKHSGAMVGHAAVEMGGRYFDSEGHTDRETLESWGALDPDDPDYAAMAGMTLKAWRKSGASHDVGVYEVSAKELLKTADARRRAKQIEDHLRRVR